MDDSQYCEFEDIAGDGFCDDEANIYSCNFDDGDCCGDVSDSSNCLQCKCWGMSGICLIDPCAKNMTQVNGKFLLIKSSKSDFIFLSAFYLIICLMKAKTNFEKIAIFKTQELVSF